MKINEVKCEYCLKDGYKKSTEELQAEWETMEPEEKKGWYTTISKSLRVKAEDVLTDIFENFEQQDIEDIKEWGWDLITDIQIDELQKILDDIYCCFDVLEGHEEITE